MRPHGTAHRPAFPLPRVLLRASALLLLAVPCASGLSSGCTTDAIGIAECREIEYARCEASVPCGAIEDVEACKRFYRDQCLHGIAGPTVPTTADQGACVTAITEAGQCAADDPDGSVESCAPGAGGLGGQAPGDGSPTVCEFIAEPWDYEVCDYLNEPPPQGGASG